MFKLKTEYFKENMKINVCKKHILLMFDFISHMYS